MVCYFGKLQKNELLPGCLTCAMSPSSRHCTHWGSALMPSSSNPWSKHCGFYLGYMGTTPTAMWKFKVVTSEVNDLWWSTKLLWCYMLHLHLGQICWLERMDAYIYPRNHAKVIEDEWFFQMSICGNAIVGSRLHRVRDRLPSFSTMEVKETYETKAHRCSRVAKLGRKTSVDSCFVDSFGPRIQNFSFCDCCCSHFVSASRCGRWSRLQHLGTNWQSCSPTWRRSIWLIGWMLGCSLSLLNIVNIVNYSFERKTTNQKKTECMKSKSHDQSTVALVLLEVPPRQICQKVSKVLMFYRKDPQKQEDQCTWKILQAEIWNFNLPNPLFLHMSLVRWRYKNFTRMRLG